MIKNLLITILILLGFTCSFSFAENVSVFSQFESNYKKARFLYDNKKYEQALPLFDALS